MNRSPGASRCLRKKIARGLLNTANNETKTWSSASMGATKRSTSTSRIAVSLSTTGPSSWSLNR